MLEIIVVLVFAFVLKDARADAEDMIYSKLQHQLDEFFGLGQCSIMSLLNLAASKDKGRNVIVVPAVLSPSPLVFRLL